MQLFADTSGLAVHVPASSEMPARGAALFGAVAAGEFDDIRAAIAATRPGTARTYRPEPRAEAIYERGLRDLPRACTTLLGSSHAELLHGLKRIRNERSPA